MNTMYAQYDSMARLNNKHREIIRLSVMGWSGTNIAKQLGMAPAVVYCILRSPLAKMEIERLQEQANAIATNLPYRIQQQEKLSKIADEAVDVNRKFMNNPVIDPRVRSKISMHFQDRLIYDKDGDDKPAGYREILRKLDEVASQIKNSETVDAPPPPLAELAEITEPITNTNGSEEARHESSDEEEKLEIVKFDQRLKQNET